MNYFIGLLFLFFTSILNAQLPLDFKGHGEVDANIKKALRIEFPNRSVMQTADKRIFVDTDEDNLLYNGSLEAAVALNGLSYTGTGILTRNVGGTQYEGDVGYNYTSAGATPGNALSFAPVTLPAGWVTTPTTIEFSCWTNTIDPNAALELANGTSIISTAYSSATIPVSSVYTKVTTTFTTSGQTVVYPRIKSTALGTSTNFDSCYVGRYKTYPSKIYIPYTSYVPTFTTVGGTFPTYTLNYAEWTRDGELASYRGRITFTGTGTWNTPCFTIPTGQSITETPPHIYSGVVTYNDATGTNYQAELIRGSATQFCIRQYVGAALSAMTDITQISPMTAAAGDSFTWEAKEVKIQEWTGTSQLAMSLNTRASDTNTIPCPSGFSTNLVGAVTTTCMYKKAGDRALIEFKIASTGTPTGGSPNMNFTLPTNWAMDTSKMVGTTGNALRGSCQMLDNGTAFLGTMTPILGSTSSQIQFYYNTSGNVQGTVSNGGPFAWANGDYLLCYVDVPIVEGGVAWTASAVPMPTVTNALTYRNLPGFGIFGTAKTAACSSNPCTVTENNNSMLTAVNGMTRSGVGSFALNFVAGFFPVAPHCWCTSVGGSNQQCNVYSETTSGATVSTLTAAGVAQDVSQFKVTCLGQSN